MNDTFSKLRVATWVVGLMVSGGALAWAEEAEPISGNEAKLLSNTRQLTFEGRRAGEGYFSADGTELVFQSERDPQNPFFQIFLLDMETGDVQRVSPGMGKTTCAWIHPDGQRVLFSSTHADPQAVQKQKDELDLRARGEERRYSWDYDETYELYAMDRGTGDYQQLTDARGYDAEGSYSPDGKQIAFASNRWAYEDGALSEEEQAKFEIDRSLFMDIYIMDTDGNNVRRLTEVDGYDGGPFFSPDGRKICWRRFSENGALAEIWTMNIDGTNQQQVTRLGAMSWAPYFHPSGDYLIFATNKHGFGNFELYLVSADGKSSPVRVTDTDGFDGLPSFTPDGTQITWTSNRTPGKQSQIFIADWNDAEARRLLGLSAAANEDGLAEAEAASAAAETQDGFAPTDIIRHVDYLCREELEGRLTGTEGERMATAYVAAYMDSLGLEPAGTDGTWFQEFEFTSGVALGKQNQLTMGDESYRVDEAWRPLAYSASMEVPAKGIVFAGYGIKAPEGENQPEYDSYVHLDVTDKWVLVFRYLPEDIPAERRQQLARYANLRFKAMTARDLGAAGMIVVSGPNATVKDQLVPLRFDGSLAGSSLPVISVTDDVASEWLSSQGRSLEELQTELDGGEPQMGFALDSPPIELAASIDIERVRQLGRNVLGRLPATAGTADSAVLVGAHIDHLGRGTGGSLARDEERDLIHYGADDNASGVAAMLEIAQYLSSQRREGKLDSVHDILFAAWSGEELGLLGSAHYAKAAMETAGSDTLYPQLVACLNLDMVGRLDKKLVLQGIGSSPVWTSEIERRNVPVGLPLTLQTDSYVPTDASTFFTHGVPSLTAFTGSHEQYHTPRDTPDRLDYDGAARIARLMGLITRGLATNPEPPTYTPQERTVDKGRGGVMRAYLGTIPDYAESDLKGVKLSGVSKTGPAAKAGVLGGDVIVELAGKKIDNIYDYTYAIQALKIGTPVTIAVMRDGERQELQVTPESRD
ncbi:MAG: M28 family peptidase [Planctomycetota bacterium]